MRDTSGLAMLKAGHSFHPFKREQILVLVWNGAGKRVEFQTRNFPMLLPPSPPNN